MRGPRCSWIFDSVCAAKMHSLHVCFRSALTLKSADRLELITRGEQDGLLATEFFHAGVSCLQQLRGVQMFFHMQNRNFQAVELLWEWSFRVVATISLAHVLAILVCFWTDSRSASRVAESSLANVVMSCCATKSATSTKRPNGDASFLASFLF